MSLVSETEHPWFKNARFFDKALEINPNDFDTLYDKGDALARLGKPEEAVASFDMVGITLTKLGKHEEAVASFDKALEINPNNMKTLSNKGVALARLGKHEESVASFDKALEINPNELDILFNKDLVLAKLNQKKNHILLEMNGN